jgi:uncharacterized protein YrrD
VPRNVKDNLRGHGISATDGAIGEIDDVYFDDEDWAIRYVVVDTGTWLSGRKVLISPHALRAWSWMSELRVALTKSRVEHSPERDTKKPVTRQHEADLLGYYGYPYYWGGAGLWGMGAYPGSMTAETRFEDELRTRRARAMPSSDDGHLRSCRAVTGYSIHAKDGEIGHVDDFLVDDRTWEIRYLVVNTSNWWLGHQMLLSPHWITDVDWSERKVVVDLTRQAITDAPAYDTVAPFDREHEKAMYSHCGHSGYWTGRPVPDAEAQSRRHVVL